MIDPRLQMAIGNVLQVAPEEVTESAAAGSLANWTSLGHLELMLAIEAEFGVRIPADKMLELTSAEAIQTFLQSHGAMKKSG